MTEEEKNARNEYIRKKRASMRDEYNAYQRERYANRTEEQIEARKDKRKKQWENLSDEEKALHNAKRRERRANETPEQKAERLEKRRAYYQRKKEL